MYIHIDNIILCVITAKPFDRIYRVYILRIYESESVSHSVMSGCEPVDCSPPGSFVYAIIQVRTQEWVAIPFSRRSFWPRDLTWVSYVAGRFCTVWASGEVPRVYVYVMYREKICIDVCVCVYINIHIYIYMYMYLREREIDRERLRKTEWRKCKKMPTMNISRGTSLAAQWLRLHASNVGGTGSIPGQRNWGPACCMTWPKKQQKQYI